MLYITNGWIKFEDKKPDKDGEYLCLTVNSPGETGFDEYTIDIQTYHTYRKSFGWYGFSNEPAFYSEVVQYWRPLPLLPWEDPMGSYKHTKWYD